MIPTTQEIADQNLTGLESNLAQTSPLNDKAFLRVLAVVEALALTGLYKFGAERIRQNLAQTATGADLDMLGNEPGVDTPRKMAESATVTAVLPATPGIIIPITASFIGANNGVRYNMGSEVVTPEDGGATLTLTAETEGAVGNLAYGDSLNIVSQVAGAGTVAAVASVVNTGVEEESDEDYRPRVMFAMQSVTGGSNATDHKTWAEEVGGVKRAYPYAGRPSGTSYPGDRTVYVESTTDINPDGVPTVGLLDEVGAAIAERSVLGITADTLWVEPITRSVVALTVTGLVAPAGTEAAVRTAIEDTAASYVREFRPYIEGVDTVQDRNDTITTPAVSDMVQAVLTATGSSASKVSFTVGGVAYDTYTLQPGELAKLATPPVTYATV